MSLLPSRGQQRHTIKKSTMLPQANTAAGQIENRNMMHHRYRSLAPDLVAVPAGVFLLGATCLQAAALAECAGIAPEWCLDETPQHQVALEAFQISRCPITCAEYMAFVIATDH